MRIPSLIIGSLFALSVCYSGSTTVWAQEKKSATTVVEISQETKSDSKKEEPKKESKWTSLLKSDSLDGWEITNFGGEGAVEVREGVLMLDRGDPMTGIHSKKKDFPQENYEMRWKARRVDGSDFFVGITFPVGKEFCSLISGGWGGGLVGISSINGNDASENETSGFRDFKNNKWYSFRVRVDKKQIKAWIDDQEVVSVDREGKSFSVRAEVMASRPLGYCVFQSVCEIKDWEYQTIQP
jgi:hypothetical protein